MGARAFLWSLWFASGCTAMSAADDGALRFADGARAPVDLAAPGDEQAPPDLAEPDERSDDPADLGAPSASIDLAAIDLATTPDFAAPHLLGADPDNPYGIRLTDVTLQALGGRIRGGRSVVNTWGAGTGCAIADFDGDGRLDVVLARDDDPFSDRPGGPSLLLLSNAPIGGFASMSWTADNAFSAALSGVHAHGAAVGDVDGDGDLDIFIAAEGPDFLFLNDGSGHFTEVGVAAGVAGRPDDISLDGVFADLNHDGLLDLYVVNWNPTPGITRDLARNRLYLNLGDGTFEDVSAASGTDNPGCSHTAGIFDFDQRGDLGIYVTSDQFTFDGEPANDALAPDAWYQLAAIDDRGVPRFKDVYATHGTKYWRSGMGVAIGDVDGDLNPDLYLSDIGKKTLYLNRLPGQPLVEMASFFNLQYRRDADGFGTITWGTRFLDLDRDGFPELWINDGYFYDPTDCFQFHLTPALLRQPGLASKFVDITHASGLEYAKPICPNGVGDPDRAGSRAAVVGDLDGDGDDDVIVAPYGGAYFVFRNDTPRLFHAVRLRLHGTVSSPDPIGATVVATRQSGWKSAAFRDAGGNLYSQGDAVVTIGLGADALARVDVRWPSGITQRVDRLPQFQLDQVVTVEEPAWLTVTPRIATQHSPPPRLVYRPVDEEGAPVGPAAAGRIVTATRSDGVPVTVTDAGDGSYTASLPHPGAPGRTVVTIADNGLPLRPRPMLIWR